MKQEPVNFYRRALQWLQAPSTGRNICAIKEKIRQAAALLGWARGVRGPHDVGGGRVVQRTQGSAAGWRGKMSFWLREPVECRSSIRGHFIWWALVGGGLSCFILACSTSTISPISAAHLTSAPGPAAPGSRGIEPSPEISETTKPAAVPAIGAPLGLIEIPSLSLFSVVVQGDDAKALASAVGHVPCSPLPGQSGRSMIIGRYDTFLHDLDKLRPGDVVAFISPQANFYYRVQTVGSYKQLSDLKSQELALPSPAPTLVLTTQAGTKRPFTVIARQEVLTQ